MTFANFYPKFLARMETKPVRILDLNGYQLANEKAIEWHSPLQDAAESCGIMLISLDGVNHWLTFEIVGGAAFRRIGFPYPDQEVISDDIGHPGLYVLSDSTWIKRLMHLPIEDWEDWQDRNRNVARSEVRHLVVATERFQIDLLASLVELDGKIIPIVEKS